MRDKNIFMMQHQPGPQLARSKLYALHFLDRRLFFDRLFLLLFLLPLLLRAAGERKSIKKIEMAFFPSEKSSLVGAVTTNCFSLTEAARDTSSSLGAG